MPSSMPLRRGRQAEAARNDQLLLDAAREVVASKGAEAPVSAIAEHAGVGIGSLYRRYPTKEALLQHLCVLAMEQALEAASAALRVQDPWEGLTRYVRSCVESRSGALAPIAGQIAVTPEMSQTSRKSLRLAEKVVARAHAAEVVRADVSMLDLQFLIGTLGRRSTAGTTDEETNARERLLAIALDGLRATCTNPLPGRRPSLDAYVNRWGST